MKLQQWMVLVDLEHFWKVTVPMLYPALFTVIVLAVGVSFGIFTEVLPIDWWWTEFCNKYMANGNFLTKHLLT